MMGRIDRCPICKGREVSTIETFREKNKIKDVLTCDSCKTLWQNVYTFSQHTKIVEAE